MCLGGSLSLVPQRGVRISVGGFVLICVTTPLSDNTAGIRCPFRQIGNQHPKPIPTNWKPVFDAHPNKLEPGIRCSFRRSPFLSERQGSNIHRLVTTNKAGKSWWPASGLSYVHAGNLYTHHSCNVMAAGLCPAPLPLLSYHRSSPAWVTNRFEAWIDLSRGGGNQPRQII